MSARHARHFRLGSQADDTRILSDGALMANHGADGDLMADNGGSPRRICDMVQFLHGARGSAGASLPVQQETRAKAKNNTAMRNILPPSP